MSTPEHLRNPNPRTLLDSDCLPECPACAEEKRRDCAVADVILPMWIDAIKSHERDLEQALQEVMPAIDTLPDANLRLAQFTRGAMRALVERQQNPPDRLQGSRRPRGLPSAWLKTNFDLVSRVREHEGLPKNHVPLALEMELGSVFIRVAAIWKIYGITDVSSATVEDGYYRWRRRLA